MTPGGRPPSHSRDGHSPPVNPPAARGARQRAAECGTRTKEASNLRHAQKDAHTILVRVAAGTAAGPSVTVMRLSKFCPPSFPNPSYHPVFEALFDRNDKHGGSHEEVTKVLMKVRKSSGIRSGGLPSYRSYMRGVALLFYLSDMLSRVTLWDPIQPGARIHAPFLLGVYDALVF